jgi:hypothetical protein
MQKKIPATEQDVQLATLIAQAGQDARNKRKSSLSEHSKKLRDIVEKAAGRLNIKQ